MEIRIDITTDEGKIILIRLLEREEIPTIEAFDGKWLVIKQNQNLKDVT